MKELQYDESYNRVPRQRNIDRIVADFKPHLLGVWLVSERADRSLVIIDGQHRTRALVEKGMEAMLVPSLTLTGLTHADEADLFRRFNQDRTAPTAVDIYRAKLAAKDPETMGIQAVLDSFGLSVNVSPQPNFVRSTLALSRLYNGGGPELLRDSLSILREAWPDDLLRGELLEGLGILLTLYPEKLERRSLVQRMQETRPSMVIGRARQIKEALGGGQVSLAVTRALVAVYNAGRSTSKLSELAIPKGGRHPLSTAFHRSRRHLVSEATTKARAAKA